MSRTTLDFEYEGKEYSLAYTVNSLKMLEKRGFSFGKLEDHILSAPEELFFAAFDANHPTTPRRVRQEIWNEFGEHSEDGNESLMDVLYEMASECVEKMRPQGNLKWRATRG